MLLTFLAIVVASLIGAGIRALFNVGKPQNLSLQNRTAATVLYQMQTGNQQNNLPMYLSKNNQQSGPFAAEQVLNLLNSGQLSPFDQAIRQGETQWQPLNMYFSVRQNQ